ncbi:MAG: hypothetical protein ACJAR2_003240, partial [Ilumatobacter sp.]
MNQPAHRFLPDVISSRTLVIACGALAHELLAIVKLNGLDDVTVECLPASLHNRPSEIPDAVRARIHRARQPGLPQPGSTNTSSNDTGPSGTGLPQPGSTNTSSNDTGPSGTGFDDAIDGSSTIGVRSSGFDSIFVAYADCGTGGLLQKLCEEEGVEMLAGAHCYEFFATAPRFAEIQDAEIGSFYLTDFLARHFERMVWQGLGLDRHPELLPMYFGNYTRLVYLAQTDNPELLALAQAGADRLGLSMLVER